MLFSEANNREIMSDSDVRVLRSAPIWRSSFIRSPEHPFIPVGTGIHPLRGRYDNLQNHCDCLGSNLTVLPETRKQLKYSNLLLNYSFLLMKGSELSQTKR